jgi:hypothetical protein
MATIPKLIAPRHIDLGIDRVYADIADRGDGNRGKPDAYPISAPGGRIGEQEVRGSAGGGGA